MAPSRKLSLVAAMAYVWGMVALCLSPSNASPFDFWYHDGTNVLDDVRTTGPGEVSLFQTNFPYSAYGQLDFLLDPTPIRRPAELHVDTLGQRVVLYHTTTYHRIVGNEGIIGIVIPESVCGSARFAGAWMSPFCVWKTNMTMLEWNNHYAHAGFVTDDIETPVSLDGPVRQRIFNERVLTYRGWSQDHHVATPVPGSTGAPRKALVELKQINKGAYKGVPYSWFWTIELGGSDAAPTSFGITFTTIKKGPIAASKFAYPTWFTAAGIPWANLPLLAL